MFFFFFFLECMHFQQPRQVMLIISSRLCVFFFSFLECMHFQQPRQVMLIISSRLCVFSPSMHALPAAITTMPTQSVCVCWGGGGCQETLCQSIIEITTLNGSNTQHMLINRFTLHKDHIQHRWTNLSNL